MEKISSNRSFGIVFFIFFLILAVWPIIHSEPLRIWSLIVASIFLFLGLINSKLLNPLNLIWVKFGELLGKIISPIVMGIIYFFVITPIGLLMHLIGKDLLKTKFNDSKTYWLKREKNIGSMKRQF
tara:strand:- start:131 stop:508 length:378 start_codon:yes stop_codon:yes gene_type:complete